MTDPAHPSSAVPRVVVIARPGLAETDDFVACLAGRVDVDVAVTESSDDVDAAVENALSGGATAVASVGGDGSINMLAAALLSAGSDLALVPVPAGTVNLATQVLGIDSIESAATSVINGSVRTIDVGSTEQGVFVLNASTGYDAAVIDDADDHSDARLGRVRFFIAGLRRLRTQEPVAVRVTVDGRHVFDARAMSVIVMNVGRRVSDSFEVAPDASFDDGVLDVMIVEADTVTRFAAVVWRLMRRRPGPHGDVVRAQGEHIRVQWAAPVAAQRDGDADEPVRTITARCLPDALRIHHG